MIKLKKDACFKFSEIFAKGIDVRSVTFYISMFDVPAHKITLNTTQSKKNKEKIYHNMVTGDA